MASSIIDNLPTPKSKLENCFHLGIKSSLGGKILELEIDDINKILNELHIDPRVYDIRLKNILPYMLIHHINHWPGWMKSTQYFSGKLTYDLFFERFKRFLEFKIKYSIKNDFQNALKLHVQDEQKRKVSGEIDKNKKVAPFKIIIEGDASVISTMVFSDAKDNIILQQHSKSAWGSFTHKNMINWPFVEVTLTTKDFGLCRRNMHQIKRYLLNEYDTANITIPQFVEQVDFVNREELRTSFTLKLLNTYFVRYLEVLKKYCDKIEKVDEISEILLECMKDMIEINVNASMASNTAVLFNIGRNFYFRNKKLNNTDMKDSSAVCFSEIIIPKVQIALNYFKVKLDPLRKKVTSFDLLDKLQDDMNEFLLMFVIPTISYKCLYCNIVFKSSKNMMDHLVHLHSMEQPVRCSKCKVQCDVMQLVSNRWSHQCATPATATVI